MLQTNLEALQTYRPEFLKLFQTVNIENSKNQVEEIVLGEARDGNSVLEVKRSGKDYRLNSKFRPVQEADKWAQQYKKDFLENIFVLYGFGNGCFARSLVKLLNTRDQFVIYEPSIQIFNYILEQEDISDIIKNPQISLVVEEVNHAEFYFFMTKTLDWRNIDALSVCRHPQYEDVFPESCVEFLRQVKECRDLAGVIKNTDVHIAKKTIENTIKNMVHIKNSNILSDFIGCIPENYPAIIVSAGPSLEKNIQELKRAKDKAFVVVVDTAVRYLTKNGITPDAVITIDANKILHFTINTLFGSVPLMCGFISRSEIVEKQDGKIVWVTGSWYMNSLYSEMGHGFLDVEIGGSVATTAFSVCEAMGFRKIILIGQDLAYGDGITHADGRVKNVVAEESGQKEVDALLGGKVRSRYDWLIYLQWFEKAIERLKDVEVIDATEGGALIHGSTVMKLSEAIDLYCTQEFSIKNLFEEAKPTFNEEEYEKVKLRIRNLEREMQNVKRKALDGVLLCDEVIHLIENNGNSVPVQKQAKKLAEANDYIVNQKAYELLDYYITDTVVEDLNEINRMTGNKEDDLINTYISAKAMYQALINAVDDLKEMIKETINNM